MYAAQQMQPESPRQGERHAVIDAARSDRYTELQAKLIANRLSMSDIDAAGGVRALIDPSIATLDSPALLPDIGIAVERIVRAIRSNERIALLVDKDCDGTSAGAALWHALVDGAGASGRNVTIHASHRLREGYGVSQGLVTRLLEDEQRPTLCITADNGSTDEPRIAELRRNGIELICTDHHEMALDGPPKSAIACINPQRDDNRFPDRSVAGCHVAWLLAATVRRERINAGESRESDCNMVDLMQYTALGTVADCVDLGRSRNNRAIVRAGLRRINSPFARPCWSALRTLIGATRITSQTLSWDASPRLNAAGRMDWATPGIHWLMSVEEQDANHWMQEIDSANKKRKEVQNELAQIVDAYLEGEPSACRDAIVVDLGTEGHIGVSGILAARLVEKYGCPAAVLSEKPGERGIRVGSLRSPTDIHLREALHAVEAKAPGLLRKAGGHRAACGIELASTGVTEFRRLLQAEARAGRGRVQCAPPVATDGSLGCMPTLSVLDEVLDVEPFGMGFPNPMWEDLFTATRAKRLSQGKHLALEGIVNRGQVSAVWFNAPADAEVLLAQPRLIAYTLQRDTYRGEQLKLHIRSIAK